MREHGGTPSQGDTLITLAGIRPLGVARGRFVEGHQLSLAGCQPSPVFMRGASSCTVTPQRQRAPGGGSPRRSASTYLPTFTPDAACRSLSNNIHNGLQVNNLGRFTCCMQ